MSNLKNYGLVRASKKTGKIDTSMTAIGKGMISLWALQNTTKSKHTVVFDIDTGEVIAHYTGTESGFPKVEKDTGEFVAYDLLQEFRAEVERRACR